jgi:hypothetical protein
VVGPIILPAFLFWKLEKTKKSKNALVKRCSGEKL